MSAASSSSSTASSSSTSRDPRKVWLGNLDPSVAESQLLKLVEPFGRVDKFDFVYAVHPDTGARSPRGFAFVTYELPESAARAVNKLDGVTLVGRRLHAKPANSLNPSADVAAARKRKLLVGGLGGGGGGGGGGCAPSKEMSKSAKIAAMEAKLRAMEAGTSDTFKVVVPKKS